MRPWLLAVLFWLCSLPSFAQKFNAGVRGGAGIWTNPSDIPDITNTSAVFAKALYVLYESKNWFATDFEITNYQLDPSKWQGEPWRCGTGVPEILSELNTYDTYEYHLSLQARISNESRLNSYLGINLASVWHYERYSSIERDWTTKEVSYNSGTLPVVRSLFGVNYYISYELTRHLNINANTLFDLDVINVVDPILTYPDARLSLSLGVGYTF